MRQIRNREAPSLQAFMVQNKSPWFPAKQFDLISLAINKNINSTVCWASIQLVVYQSALAIKAFTHITSLTV
jgi:hypothetical protein